MTEVGLMVLRDAHLEVDTVADDVDFSRLKIIEEVTVIPVEVAHSIVIGSESLVEQLLIVNVTLLHTKHRTEIVGRVDRVAHPGDITQIVFLTFRHLQVDIHMLGIIVIDTILENHCITITILIVFLNEVFLILLPAVGRELLRLEERREFTGLMGLLESALTEKSTFYLQIGELIIAVNDDTVHALLLLLVDDHIKNYLILLCHIRTLVDFDIGILEALLVEILLCQNLGTAKAIDCHLRAGDKSELILHVLALRFLHSYEVDLRDTGIGLEVEMKIYLIAYKRVSSNGDVGKHAMLPITFHCFRDVIARHGHSLPHCEPRDTC